MKNIFIQSISSDIGYELALFWLSKGHCVRGTYRNVSEKTQELEDKGVELIRCDLLDKHSVDECGDWINRHESWDVIILAAGTQDPIGMLENINFDEWENSILQNFTRQIRLIHKILPSRNKHESTPVVLMFAGGGTNNATVRYSAYTISKIALIKMCELLYEEINDTIFTILGPGWVNTKIHQSTLNNSKGSGQNFQRTIDMLNDGKCYPIKKVVECCDWLINSSKELVSGRNFSAVDDPWGNKKINDILNDENNFKLRRSGNNLFFE